MARLTVRSAAPTAAPDTLPAPEVAVIATRAGVQLRLLADAAAAAPIAVRPWWYLGGRWEPLRADGVGGVGTEPVTADASKYDGHANGIYMCGPTAVPFCLVAESGAASDLSTADLDEYFVRS
jgi:hypothetical protein